MDAVTALAKGEATRKIQFRQPLEGHALGEAVRWIATRNARASE
jgi:hypothetical protein